MQIIKVSRDSLLRPLQLVSGIVERRHTLPILANVYLNKEGENVTLISTDIEMQIETQSAIGSGDANATVTVGARKLLDILSALPKDAMVELSITDKRAILQSDKSRFTLQTMDAGEFPFMKATDEATTTFSIPQGRLRNLINHVHFAMAQQDIRYYLNGLLLSVEGTTLTAVSTDGHRLALASVELEGNLEKQAVIVPRKTILQLLHLLGEGEEEVKVQISVSQIRFNLPSLQIVSKLVDGKFPEYNRVIPKGHKNELSLSRQGFLQSLQRISILTSEKFRSVRWALHENRVVLTCSNTEQEEASEELFVNYTGAEFEIGFNISYLLDVLNNLKSEEIKVALGNANSSALLTVAEDPSFNYVLMPMRI